MFLVHLTLNGKHFKQINFSKPLSIRNLIDNDNIAEHDIIAYRTDYIYRNSGFVINQDTQLDCISYDSFIGHLIYQDTAIFILMMAYYKLFPDRKSLVIEHSVGDGVFCEVFDDDILKSKEIEILKKEMRKIINESMTIEKELVPSLTAARIFKEMNRDDILKNLTMDDVTIHKCGNYHDYYLRNLAENTSFVKEFDIIYHSPGLILRFPRKKNRKIIDKFKLPIKLFQTHQEHDKWLNILNVHNISSLNRAVKNYSITDIIQIEEALHEKKIIDIADKLSWNKNAKIALIAGPSSSGKTTFASRLSIQLKVNGINPKVINLDDYFLPRTETPRKRNGEYDFESIKSINLDLLNDHLNRLLMGEEIEPPKYNFLTGVSEKSYRKVKLDEGDILIMEGIHGLNDSLTSSVPFHQKVKIYVSALNNLNIDNHNRIRTSDSRKIRRIVRDFNYRGHTSEQTLTMWNDVREGEDKNIFPFQENADFMFNSILTYELGVLKKYIVPLLQEITEFSIVFQEAQDLLQLFNHIESIEDDQVPSNSILREFIGKSIFRK